MQLAWQFVRKNGYSMSEALKAAWLNTKLKAALSKRVIKFYFQKVDGSLREAYALLCLNPCSNGRYSQRIHLSWYPMSSHHKNTKKIILNKTNQKKILYQCKKTYTGMRIPCTPTLSITQYNFSYIIRQSYPYCAVIWLGLAPNMAGIGLQQG